MCARFRFGRVPLMLGLVVPSQSAAFRLNRGVGLLLVCRQLFHALDQTVRSHVGPMLIDEFEAGGAAVRLVNDGPALRYLDEGRPKGMLSFVVDQDVIHAVFVFERIGHAILLRAQLRDRISFIAISRATDFGGWSRIRHQNLRSSSDAGSWSRLRLFPSRGPSAGIFDLPCDIRPNR